MRIIISTNTVLKNDLSTLPVLSVIEYLIRYGYVEEESVYITTKEWRKWWLGGTQSVRSLETIKKELGRKKGAKFESSVIYRESEIRIKELNWEVVDASWKPICYRKKTEGWLFSSFKLERSYPHLKTPFIIEHDALSYLITKENNNGCK